MLIISVLFLVLILQALRWTMDLYDYCCLVGKGAFGTCDLYKSKTDEKLVVVKKISLFSITEREKQVAYNEVDVMSKLRHPNIILYYDWFVEQDTLCIIMEYASGGSLQNFIRERTQLIPELDVVYMFGQLVHGLHHIHQQEILHRDLKPSNILLQPACGQLILKIADFGLSKILEGTSQATNIIGTPSFMAPELCEGHPYKASSDIWALGCVLYELMTLRRAFQGQSLCSVVRSIMRNELAPPSMQVYSSLLCDLVDTLLRTEPQERPTTAMIMAHPAVTETCFKLYVNTGAILVG